MLFAVACGLTLATVLMNDGDDGVGIRGFGSLISRIYNSPTITTWASNLARSVSFLVVLPLMLKQFSPEEISLWYLFNTILSLQTLVDLGFSPTFSRSIAYATGGAKSISDFHGKETTPVSNESNWELVDRIWHTMRFIYTRIGIVYHAGVIVIGTVLLYRPISLLEDLTKGWISWAIVAISAGGVFWSTVFSAYLQGMNEIPRLRRVEVAVLLGMALTNSGILICGGGLVALVIGTQVWSFAGVVLLYRMCRQIHHGTFQIFARAPLDTDILRVVWNGAWRSGIGTIMSYGVVQLTGLFYAQIGNARQVASYLLSLRFAQTISQFSQAPFYTKLPLLARLRSGGQEDLLVTTAKYGMVRSHLVFALGVVLVGLSVHPVLNLISSNVEFVGPQFWVVLSWAFFSERYGAMHLQLFSISNRIIWHIANGVSGALNIGLMVATYDRLGILSFPLSMLISYTIFYTWYTASHSYKEFQLPFPKFEISTSVPAVLILLTYTAWVYL